MAMLAEPRRKQKVINLRAKNNAWSNDSTKFGQRMLEKMGWTSGKGLGANENGIVEHVVAKYKNDERGLGFEDKNDQWTKHEDDFNALLANLSNGSETKEILHSGKSLEDKSKKSKARIHYHKFTRGKDMSRYSEKDLANIFGKKSFKEPVPTEEKQKEDIKTTEQVFTEKGSMIDYFKNKLAAIKSKTKMNVTSDHKINDVDKEEANCGFQGFSQNNDVEESENTYVGFGFKQSNSDDNSSNSINFVKAKKNKSKDIGSIEVPEVIVDDTLKSTINDFDNGDQDEENNLHKSKKKKKSKNKDKNIYNSQIDNSTENTYSEQIELDTEKTSVKKTKKSKSKNTNDNVHIGNPDICQGEAILENITKKKKKSKYPSYTEENKGQDDQSEYIAEVKNTKRKKSQNITEEGNNEIDADIEIDVPKKKKKRKNKDD